MKVEDEIKLAHIPEIPVQHLDISMHNLQRQELVVARRDGTDEEERSVSPIDDLGVYERMPL